MTQSLIDQIVQANPWLIAAMLTPGIYYAEFDGKKYKLTISLRSKSSFS